MKGTELNMTASISCSLLKLHREVRLAATPMPAHPPLREYHHLNLYATNVLAVALSYLHVGGRAPTVL